MMCLDVFQNKGSDSASRKPRDVEESRRSRSDTAKSDVKSDVKSDADSSSDIFKRIEALKKKFEAQTGKKKVINVM